MIDHISGVVCAVVKGAITVDVGSLGFSIHVPNSSVYKLEQKAKLFIHMHWNQEQGPSLFGFATELEKTVFLLIISCSGIGPKIGLAVLKDLGAEPFLQAIQMEDERALGSVGGLGPKKVEQIIVQLKRKVGELVKSGIDISAGHQLTDWQNVSDVLASLNYSRSEVSRAMKFLSDNYADAELPFDGLVRHALSFLAKKR